MDHVFRYAIDLRLAAFWAPFGLRPAKDGVTITDDGRFVASFGFVRVATPLANVDDAHITTGYRWWTAAGARLSFADDGLTFGTNAAGGVSGVMKRAAGSRRGRGRSAPAALARAPRVAR